MAIELFDRLRPLRFGPIHAVVCLARHLRRHYVLNGFGLQADASLAEFKLSGTVWEILKSVASVIRIRHRNKEASLS